ncbi:MAG TPA: beta-ketoacyl-ACP synthase, partial [Demequinaceae bacterium]
EAGGLSTQNVAHINAHATSTVVGDMIEARAIRTLLGAHADRTLLSATKSMTGHLLGGAGAVESILTIKAIQDRKAPPTINVTQPDPELEVDLVCDIPRAMPSGDVVGINNSFGFGGHNCALAFTNA